MFVLLLGSDGVGSRVPVIPVAGRDRGILWASHCGRVMIPVGWRALGRVRGHGEDGVVRPGPWWTTLTCSTPYALLFKNVIIIVVSFHG